MKRTRMIICIVMVLCVLFSLAGCGAAETENAKGTETTAAETTVDNTPVAVHSEIENLQNSFSPAVLGGILYIEDDGTIVVNLVESEFKKLSSSTEERNGIKIIYKPVKLSLAELENVKEQLEPFMPEYKIATLDANEVTNKIDIQLYEENAEINSLVSEYIDLEHVNISVLPEGYRFEFPTATAPPDYN